MSLPEDVRMPADHLFVDGPADVVDIELASLLGDPAMKDDLQQEIAQLVTQRSRRRPIQSLQDLVTLLDQHRLEGFRCLLLIPRASTGTPQRIHQLHEPPKMLMAARISGAVVT